MNPIDILEKTVKIPSHESVAEIREYILNKIPGTELDKSGCVVANKGSGEPHIILNTHMDVVDPHVPAERDGDKIRGRGACDAKASLAAMATAFTETDPENGELTLVISPDEETNSTGLHSYVEQNEPRGDLAIVGEPTGLQICNSSRGRYEAVVEFRGESAHAASKSGKSAVRCAAEAVLELEDMEPKTDPMLGESILTVTEINGGGTHNRVPETAMIFIDHRSTPQQNQQQFLDEIREKLSDINCEVEAMLSERPTPYLEAFRTEPNNYIERFREINRDLTGNNDIKPFDAASEASYLAEYVPTIIYGPGYITENGSPVAHSPNEYVDVEHVNAATDTLTTFLQDEVG